MHKWKGHDSGWEQKGWSENETVPREGYVDSLSIMNMGKPKKKQVVEQNTPGTRALSSEWLCVGNTVW